MMKIAHLYTYALLKTLLVFEHKKPKPQFANMNDFKRGAPNQKVFAIVLLYSWDLNYCKAQYVFSADMLDLEAQKR